MEKSIAIAPEELMPVAALFYEKVWIPQDFIREYSSKRKIRKGIKQLSISMKDDASVVAINQLELLVAGNNPSMMELLVHSKTHDLILKYKNHGYSPTYFSTDYDSFASIFPSEETISPEENITIFEVMHKSINTIDIDLLTWEHVVEIRKDIECFMKVQKFKNFIFDNIADKRSIEEIAETVNEKYEDYLWSLRKHGIETKLGLVKQFLNSSELLKISAAITLGSITGNEFIAALIASGLMIGNSSIYLVEQKLKKTDILREASKSEIALFLNINK